MLLGIIDTCRAGCSITQGASTLGTNKRYPSERPRVETAPPPVPRWHPVQIAEPIEWELRNGWPPDPIAIVRRLDFQRGNQVDSYYRAVTWAPSSDGRELIGYYPTLELACTAAWEHRHGRTLTHSPFA
jgi:hypothetical protein